MQDRHVWFHEIDDLVIRTIQNFNYYTAEKYLIFNATKIGMFTSQTHLCNQNIERVPIN